MSLKEERKGVWQMGKTENKMPHITSLFQKYLQTTWRFFKQGEQKTRFEPSEHGGKISWKESVSLWGCISFINQISTMYRLGSQ